MCIINDEKMLQKERSKTGRLTLWKVVEKSGIMGIWYEIFDTRHFQLGVNIARPFTNKQRKKEPGRFHGFLSRKSARDYKKHRIDKAAHYYLVDDSKKFKIVKVYADRKDIMEAGVDKMTEVCSISVSKMTIKSLKHQR